ncbi:hypothetical protein D3C71_1568580 [compost metagenome]
MGNDVFAIAIKQTRVSIYNGIDRKNEIFLHAVTNERTVFLVSRTINEEVFVTSYNIFTVNVLFLNFTNLDNISWVKRT